MGAVPGDTPLTRPAASIVATEVLPLLHTPPGVRSLNCDVVAVHTLKLPVIEATTGGVLTVTAALIELMQPLLLAAVV